MCNYLCICNNPIKAYNSIVELKQKLKEKIENSPQMWNIT